MNAVARTREFTDEVVEEVKKVTWPDWPQLRSATLVILVFVIIVSAIIWLMDQGVSAILNLIHGFFG